MRIRGDSSGLRGDLESARSEVESSLKQIAATAAGVIASFGFAGAAFLKRGLGLATGFEQTTIAFETMMGSAEETKQLLSDLTTFAAKTPFEMPEIEQAARGLVQFGERGDELMDTLNLLGNAAAGTSTPFGMLALVFNQVRGVGKLLTQDFRQLSTRGVISLQDIADHFKVTTEEAQNMLSTGKVSFEDLRAILKGLSQDGGRFANLMEKQSRSLGGLMSTLTDDVNITARMLSSSLVPAAKTVTSAFIALSSKLREFVELSGGVASAALVGGVAISGLTTAVVGLKVAAVALGTSMTRLILMGVAATGVGAAVIALGAGIGALVGWIASLKPVQEAAARAADRLKAAWEHLKTAALAIFEPIARVVTTALGITFTTVTALVGHAVSSLIDKISMFALDLSQWAQAIAENWKALWNEFPEIVSASWSFILDVSRNSMDALLKSISFGMGRIIDVWLDSIFEMKIALASLTGQELSENMKKAARQMLQVGKNVIKVKLGLEAAAPDLKDIFDPSEATKKMFEGIDVFDDILKRKRELEAMEFAGPIHPGMTPEGAGAAGDAFGKAASRHMLEAGRSSFTAFGTKIQDAMLKDKDDEAKKHTDLLKKHSGLLQQVADNTKNGPQPAVLT